MRNIFYCLNFIFLFSFQIFFSCNGQIIKPSDEKSNKSGTVISDIPLNGRGEKILAYDFVRRMEQKLQFGDISYGYDSIQLRIWFSYAFADSGQLVILKYQNNKWEGQLVTYAFLNRTPNRIDTISTIKSKNPKSGWSFFMAEIYKLQILTLPDMDEILKDSIVISDGDAITVEYGTKTKYRLYQYVSPFKYAERWKEIAQMEGIVQLIEEEFDFKRLR